MLGAIIYLSEVGVFADEPIYRVVPLSEKYAFLPSSKYLIAVLNNLYSVSQRWIENLATLDASWLH